MIGEASDADIKQEMVFNTTMAIITDVTDQAVLDLGITRISYLMVCPEVFKTQQSEYKQMLTKK